MEYLITSFEAHPRHWINAQQGVIFTVRNLLNVAPEVMELAHSEAVRALVEPFLGERFFPVRGILFDKVPDANWEVP